MSRYRPDLVWHAGKLGLDAVRMADNAAANERKTFNYISITRLKMNLEARFWEGNLPRSPMARESGNIMAVERENPARVPLLEGCQLWHRSFSGGGDA